MKRKHAMSQEIIEWMQQTNCSSPLRCRQHIELLQDALTDIANDYNINEGAEGIPITPGHKRCVDRANEAILQGLADKFARGD